MARYRSLSEAQTTALAALARMTRDNHLGREITLRMAEDHVVAYATPDMAETRELACRPDTIHSLVRLGALVHREGQIDRHYYLSGRAYECLDYTNMSPIRQVFCDARYALNRTLHRRGRLMLALIVIVVLAGALLALTGRLSL